MEMAEPGAEGISRMTGLETLPPGADWWPDDATTAALRAVPKPKPRDPNPPDWAIAAVEKLGREYARKERERRARS